MSYGTLESCGSRYRSDSSTRSRESLVFLTGGFSDIADRGQGEGFRWGLVRRAMGEEVC